MNKEIQKLFDEYRKRFKESFPLNQAPETEIMIKHIKVCLVSNISAPKKYPDIYGAAEGKLI